MGVYGNLDTYSYSYSGSDPGIDEGIGMDAEAITFGVVFWVI